MTAAAAVPPATITVTDHVSAAGGRFAAASRLLARRLADHHPPGLAVSVTSGPDEEYFAYGGWSDLGSAAGQPRPVAADTLFDLASLTKVIVTLPAVLLLCQRGTWRLDDPIDRWLPDAPRGHVTIRHCLTHTSGLVPYRPFYQYCSTPEQIRGAVLDELAGAAPGNTVGYSDLNFMLLAWAVECRTAAPLDEVARHELFDPLDMTDATFRPLPADRQRSAATELRNGAHPVRGEVHDGNAFALGGVSGHAGLFATARDVRRFVAALLRPRHHPVLSAETIRLMMTRQAATGDDVRALGWRLDPRGWGDWPASTIWHTGFTGTSVLVSPVLDTAVVVLSNAVHPVRRKEATAGFRVAAHTAIRSCLADPCPVRAADGD